MRSVRAHFRGAKGDQEAIYEGLDAGDYLGKAYFKTKQKAEQQFMNGDHAPGDIVSGVLMIGNPFVQIRPFNK